MNKIAEPFPCFYVAEKDGGDYIFRGLIVATFRKRSGQWRYVVENDDGILHIFSGKQLTVTEPETRNDALIESAGCSALGDKPE